MEFSIVTPSLNMLRFLKRCHRSVRDQENTNLEHIVVDAVSTDGTGEWLSDQPNVVSIVESDRGMYDAVNKGLAISRGKILSYLNCDEQYLPGTLSFVREYFDKHPEVDVLFGDTLLIRPDGRLIAFRKGYAPRKLYIKHSYLYVSTCTMFFRRRILEAGLMFDPTARIIGDEKFVLDVLDAGFRVQHVSRYLAAFTVTGNNLCMQMDALAEKNSTNDSSVSSFPSLRSVVNAMRLLEKAVSGAYFQEWPLVYEVYADDESDSRKVITEYTGTFRWPS